MRLILACAALAIAAFQATPAAAQTPVWYCDALGVYSPPYRGNCPAPWRPAAPTPAAPQPYAASPGPIALVPQTARPSFPILGDSLDDWCKTVSLPSSIAVCSDRDLRALVLERQRAYDEAKARLNPEQQKALLADQNGWVHSYPRTCGLTDAPPALPLAPAIQDCMAQAGRARIAYLRNYGASEATTSATTSHAANPADVRSQMAPVVPEPPALSAEDERQAEICKEQNYPFQISAACVNLKVKQGKVEISQKCGNSIVTLSDEVSAACIDLKEKLLTHERSFCSDPRFFSYLDFCDH